MVKDIAIGARGLEFDSWEHIYVMYPTPTELHIPILFACHHEPETTAALSYLRCALKSPSYRKVAAIPQIMAFINPRFVGIKQGFAGVGYST